MKLDIKEFDKLPVLEKIRIHQYLSINEQRESLGILAMWVSISFATHNIFLLNAVSAGLFSILGMILLLLTLYQQSKILIPIQKKYPKVVKD